MVPLPTISQFPSFTTTISLLTNNGHQCIWYLPDKGRCCLGQITGKDDQDTLRWASSVCKSGPSATSVLKNLAKIAENCCCPRHHRNKIYGSGLADELAKQWHNEMLISLGLTTHRTVVNMKVDDAAASSIPVTFAKHHVLKEETLLSKLLSDIALEASKNGRLYIYTHAEEAFRGMIKIGYTAKAINLRLEAWTKCGHGSPKLVGSFDDVRHPERVELLVHFELLESWYEQRWCRVHARSHIEWFKVDLERATTIARLWCKWMRHANPYDRRGRLTVLWRGHIEFLVQHGNPITAEAMVQIQEIEEGSDKVYDFIDDKALRERQNTPVKKEEDEDEDDISSLARGFITGIS